MKYLPFLSFIAAIAITAVETSAVALERRSTSKGIDVSSVQAGINWKNVKANGVSFAYIQATEGGTYKNPEFSDQHTRAASSGLIRGAYHFAHPDSFSGATEAKFFLANGGGWKADGITLPGAISLHGVTAARGPWHRYGLGQDAMVSCINEFSGTYFASTQRYPVIHTTTNWWKNCTGNSPIFGATHPLWISRWGSSVGPLPACWGYHTFWQNADSGPNPGNHDVYNGDGPGLSRLARG